MSFVGAGETYNQDFYYRTSGFLSTELKSRMMAITRKLSHDSESILLYLGGTRSTMERHKHKIKESCQMTENLRSEKAFRELLEAHYIMDAGEGIYNLTEAGSHLARGLQSRSNGPHTVNNISTKIENMNGGSATLAGIQDIYNTPLSYASLLEVPNTGSLAKTDYKPNDDDNPILQTRNTPAYELPTFAEHPLRVSTPEPSAAAQRKNAASKQKRGASPSVRYLLVFDGAKDALPLPIVSGDVIGRSKKANIQFKHDDYISNRHSVFTVERDRTTNKPALYVEDMGSRNGTFVDGYDTYDTKVQLQHGSKVRVGNTVLIVVEIPL
jgi:FHA domain